LKEASNYHDYRCSIGFLSTAKNSNLGILAVKIS
jgi:hypothetical protein